MVVDAIFDSVCRCLGASPVPGGTGPGGTTSVHGKNKDGISPLATSQSDVKRRTERLHLQDKQFDALFEDGVKPPSRRRTSGVQQNAPSHRPTPPRTAATTTAPRQHELEQARAVAKAKLVATQGRKRRGTKRKNHADDIFRTKGSHGTAQQQSSLGSSTNRPSTFSRFLSNNPVMANALCFATPIHENESSDDHTLNTTEEEDTITSTLAFERKYAHVVEHRPPMPLFDQFKVVQDNELRKIVATDSHNSLKMISLLQDYHPSQQQQKRQAVVQLEDSEDEEEDEAAIVSRRGVVLLQQQQQAEPSSSHGKKKNNNHDEDDDVPPPVKMMTDSSSSSSTSSRSFERRR